MKYVHTNIISDDVEKLADFYIKVFNCEKNWKDIKLIWKWLEEWTWVQNANIKWIFLKLPWYEQGWPMLEIFQYDEMLEKEKPIIANRKWFGHIAFQVDDIEKVLENAVQHGWTELWKIVSKEYKTGVLTFVYIRDPEWNIIELQKWENIKL